MGGMWDGAEISRWRGARRFRPSGWSRGERAVPAPCIATGTGDSRFALREKLLMRALLAQAALVEHEDAIGVLNGCSGGAR